MRYDGRVKSLDMAKVLILLRAVFAVLFTFVVVLYAYVVPRYVAHWDTFPSGREGPWADFVRGSLQLHYASKIGALFVALYLLVNHPRRRLSLEIVVWLTAIVVLSILIVATHMGLNEPIRLYQEDPGRIY